VVNTNLDSRRQAAIGRPMEFFLSLKIFFFIDKIRNSTKTSRKKKWIFRERINSFNTQCGKLQKNQ
jgi:hypothetical protein